MSFENPWGNYLLKAIVETKAPDAISFWPQTIAWQLLLILLIVLMIKKSYQSWRNYQANAYRREALTWLTQCSLVNEEHVRQLPTLLRKTAIIAVKRLIKDSDNLSNKTLAVKLQQDITGLRGKAWLEWLDLQCDKTNFNNKSTKYAATANSCETLLSQLAYMPKVTLDDALFNKELIQLRQQIELWIKFHQLLITPEPQPLEAMS